MSNRMMCSEYSWSCAFVNKMEAASFLFRNVWEENLDKVMRN